MRLCGSVCVCLVEVKFFNARVLDTVFNARVLDTVWFVRVNALEV